MQSGPKNIQFFFGTQVVGYFEDQPPSSAGQYRYEPFRGPGHLCLVQELARKGPQCCHYVANGETRGSVNLIWPLSIVSFGPTPTLVIMYSS